MTRVEDRPVKTCAELSSPGSITPNGPRALLNYSEFMKAVKAVAGRSIDRRLLMYYSSPQVRLMPRPVYVGGHVSHYLYPEHTQRLAVILHLRTKYFFPFKLIREVLAGLLPEHYVFILGGRLTGDDIRQLARPAAEGQRIYPRDLILARAARLLSAAQSLDNSGPRKARQAPNSRGLGAVPTPAGRKVGGQIDPLAQGIKPFELMIELNKICGGLVASQGKLGALQPHPTAYKRENSDRKTEETTHGNAGNSGVGRAGGPRRAAGQDDLSHGKPLARGPRNPRQGGHQEDASDRGRRVARPTYLGGDPALRQGLERGGLGGPPSGGVSGAPEGGAESDADEKRMFLLPNRTHFVLAVGSFSS